MGVCRGCGAAFWVCPFCDRHGEVRYCGTECRRVGRKRIERDGKRHYRHSPEGQAQHRDEERDCRARRPGRRGRPRRMGERVTGGTCVQVVGEPPPTVIEFEASSCARGTALSSTVEVATACARSTTDDGLTDGDVGPPGGGDAALDDGGPGRANAGGARSGDGGAPQGGGDAARGAGALAPAGSVRCAVCGRLGRYVATSAGRRAGFWRQERALRGRGGAARRPASSASNLQPG